MVFLKSHLPSLHKPFTTLRRHLCNIVWIVLKALMFWGINIELLGILCFLVLWTVRWDTCGSGSHGKILRLLSFLNYEQFLRWSHADGICCQWNVLLSFECACSAIVSRCLVHVNVRSTPKPRFPSRIWHCNNIRFTCHWFICSILSNIRPLLPSSGYKSV